MTRGLPIVAVLATVCAWSVQAGVPAATLSQGSSTVVSPALWQALGSRQTVGATVIWAQTVADYASGTLSPQDIAVRVSACRALDPSAEWTARLGVLMVATLSDAHPDTHFDVQHRMLRSAARFPGADPWFAQTLAVHLARPTGPSDRSRNWMAYAEHQPTMSSDIP